MNDEVCFVRSLPLKKVITNHKVLRKIEELVCIVNDIVRETYCFIRAFFIYTLALNRPPPLIDKKFVRNVISTITQVSSRGRKTTEQESKDVIVEFYETKFKHTQKQKIQKPNGLLLEYEVVGIITAIENHIKTKFYGYVSKLVSCKVPDRKERLQVMDDLFKGTMSDGKYQHFVAEYQNIHELFAVHKSEPQRCLPMMYKICCVVKQECPTAKLFSFLPLRHSLVPCFITFARTTFKDIFKSEDEWTAISGVVSELFKAKDGFNFSSIKTNGVGCSVVFTKGRHRKKKKQKTGEIYFDDLTAYDEFKDKKIVAIDPNKGNLVYCFDGERTLRYTQNERRFVSKKSKYKEIRRDVEKNSGAKLKEQYELLSATNSKSTDCDEFLRYVVAKNNMVGEIGGLYERVEYRKLRENVKINLRRSEDKFVQKFKDTYGKDAVIVFGDWEERMGFLRGKEPTKGKSLRRMFRKTGFKVYLLDEFRTSKICHKCHGENQYNFTNRKDKRPWKKEKLQKVWGLSRCTSGCGRIHQRDFNSVSNILSISRSWIYDGIRPSVFCRSSSLCGNIHPILADDPNIAFGNPETVKILQLPSIKDEPRD